MSEIPFIDCKETSSPVIELLRLRDKHLNQTKYSNTTMP